MVVYENTNYPQENSIFLLDPNNESTTLREVGDSSTSASYSIGVSAGTYTVRVLDSYGDAFDGWNWPPGKVEVYVNSVLAATIDDNSDWQGTATDPFGRYTVEVELQIPFI